MLSIMTRSSRGRSATGKDAPTAKRQLNSVGDDHAVSTGSTLPLRPTSSSLPLMNGDGNGSSRPAKRRRLDLRFRQSTLDSHFFSPHDTSISPALQADHVVLETAKPSDKLTNAQPHGSVIETIGGDQNELDVREDDVDARRISIKSSSPAATDEAALVVNSHSDVLVNGKNNRLGKKNNISRASTPRSQASGNKQEDKRSLRSHDDGPRLKSDLAIYFSNYEDIIFDTPGDEDLITVDTSLYITDDPNPKRDRRTTPPTSAGKSPGTTPHRGNRRTSLNGSNSAFASINNLNGSQRLNLEFAVRNLPETTLDPMADEHFQKSHRRAERREKQLRNIEKERAMHEKVQLDRLLDSLLSHDWLRVMGISGITESEAKRLEPKRDYFIAEVQALVSKFRAWKEEEKRQRMQKDEARRAAEEESHEEPGDSPHDTRTDDNNDDDSTQPSPSDLNASAAQQLRQEAAESLKWAALPLKASSKVKANDSWPHSPPLLTEPITSFYRKRHLRDAALRKGRHGRNITAFGFAVPNIDEKEFELPEDFISDDILRANARERRARKRRSVADGTSEG